MSVLAEASYTRKDGQYLRWDNRSQRQLKFRFNIGHIANFGDALERRVGEIAEDIPALRRQFGRGYPNLRSGSCLEILRAVPDGAFDLVVTSPPYANRYDYARTSALELAWTGFDQEGFSVLRQRMLSATVENKAKTESLDKAYGDSREILDRSIQIYEEQSAVHEVLGILHDRQGELSNRNVMRLVDQYFFEMALTITELGRVVRPGGIVIMVNNNVQYHGEELPVDIILADFAERSSFHCDKIWKFARGKGNASQQMARFGRRELRKCVYR